MGLQDLTRGMRKLVRYHPDVVDREFAELGSRYVVYAVKTVAGGGSLNLRLANPTTDRTIDVSNIEIVADVAGRFRIHDRVDSPAGGTTLPIQNSLLDKANGSPDSGSMTAEQDVTFTSQGKHLEVPTLATGTGTSPPGEDTGTQPLIEPGREIIVEVEDTNSNGGEVGIFIQYRELDRVPSDQFDTLTKLRV